MVNLAGDRRGDSDSASKEAKVSAVEGRARERGVVEMGLIGWS